VKSTSIKHIPYLSYYKDTPVSPSDFLPVVTTPRTPHTAGTLHAFPESRPLPIHPPANPIQTTAQSHRKNAALHPLRNSALRRRRIGLPRRQRRGTPGRPGCHQQRLGGSPVVLHGVQGWEEELLQFDDVQHLQLLRNWDGGDVGVSPRTSDCYGRYGGG
jgi:hypothetical protein